MSANILAAVWTRATTRFGRLWSVLDMARTRKALNRLDDHMLRDIGVSRHEAEAESARAFWDPPSHWHKSQLCPFDAVRRQDA